MAREFSAGGVVLRKMKGKWCVAAIRPRRGSGTATKRAQADVLALPKGIIDPGERPEVTAVREVQEETGLKARIVTKLGDVKYVYRRTWDDGARVFKIVSFYLLHYTSGRLGDIAPETRHEVEAAEWIALEEASKRLAYNGERDMAKRAQQYLLDHGNDVKQET